MIRALRAKLESFHGEDRGTGRFSILVPFLIISTGLGVLAWRSYHLSVRMERGANVLAAQYVAYAADITARRVDAALRAELMGVSEEWQQVERRGGPTAAEMREWIGGYDWIRSAIYVPDYDPENAFYVGDTTSDGEVAPRMAREFITSAGIVRYTYDPRRLLAHVRGALRQQPLFPAKRGDTLAIQQQADVSLIPSPPRAGLVNRAGGFDFISPLAPPFNAYSVRAVVKPSHFGSGWENQRVISLWMSLGALALTTLGAYLALRGLRREADTMRLRGALIANVSHELRTPLAMIRLGAETLRLTKLKEQERRDLEEQILREVLHLSHLVENVLDVARIQHRQAKALAFTPVYPKELVTTLVTTYASWIRSKGFEVSLQIDESIGEQHWDRDSVSRALLNLIDNAIKYSSDDKAITVVLRQTPEHVIIEVKDRGIGIEMKEQSRIFDPYYRAKFSDTQTRRGAGLGLTLVQQIVASHGGHVEVESTPGAGSTFRLLFPSVPPQAAHEVSNFIHVPLGS